MSSGAAAERFREAWAEIRQNLGRTTLQALGVVLGVASVLGGFAISDSQRRHVERLYARTGGLDKLHVQPKPFVRSGQPTALQAANLGLRAADAAGGAALDPGAVAGVATQKLARVQVRSPLVGQERQVTGIGADFIPMEGHAIARGRGFAARELEAGSPVAILGTEPARTFFPDGDALGRTLVVGGIPVTVVGTFRPRVFRWREGQDNLFKWRNHIIALPAAFVQRRLQADPHLRLDLVTFKLPELSGIQAFSDDLAAMLRTSHRAQSDFRLDDVAAREKRMSGQGQVYRLVFVLSGLLALLGGGIVNVNIQMASLKERVREVGLKMALGASGREVFKGFMTEAMLLTVLGTAAGLGAGAGFSWGITRVLGIPLYMSPGSFLWAFLLAGVFGFAFALYPAWKASRLSPMEALRYE